MAEAFQSGYALFEPLDYETFITCITSMKAPCHGTAKRGRFHHLSPYYLGKDHYSSDRTSQEGKGCNTVAPQSADRSFGTEHVSFSLSSLHPRSQIHR